MRVGADAMACIQVAQEVYQYSGGLFDPTVGPLMECWKDAAGQAREPSDEELERALRRVGLPRLTVDVPEFTVGWNQAPGALDLGGIGKGYAIDKAAELLADWEIENAVISGGGSTVLAIGSARDRADGWSLGIGGDWGDAAGVDAVVLKSRALSGSGKEVKGDHIINPKTGRPASANLAAWALAPDAAVADGLSTAFMMMDRKAIEVLCREKQEFGAFIVAPDGTVTTIGLEVSDA